MPVGVSGELYIGGDGLARDYLNRPELTAEKFIRNPFAADPRAAVSDRRLVRFGRTAASSSSAAMDQQVKIRGFRIELQEIEAVFRSIPASARA